RKRNSGLVAEETRITAVAESDGRKRRPGRLECRLMLAQLRDVLAAEDSSVVAKKDGHRRTARPERTEAPLVSIGIRQGDPRERGAERVCHDGYVRRVSRPSAAKPWMSKRPEDRAGHRSIRR